MFGVTPPSHRRSPPPPVGKGRSWRPEIDSRRAHVKIRDVLHTKFLWKGIPVLSGVFLGCVTLLAAGVAAQGPAFPDELDDSEFWRLVVNLSEPDGYFEDENYVSNELGYQRIMQRLQDSIKPGGV